MDWSFFPLPSFFAAAAFLFAFVAIILLLFTHSFAGLIYNTSKRRANIQIRESESLAH